MPPKRIPPIIRQRFPGIFFQGIILHGGEQIDGQFWVGMHNGRIELWHFEIDMAGGLHWMRMRVLGEAELEDRNSPESDGAEGA